MAPCRSSRTSNRQTRTAQIDHDVFEGLPVRHWRKKPTYVNAAPEKDLPKAATMLQNGYKELPLPRDFSMLPESSQVLLRAARMGLRRRAEAIEDEKENEDNESTEANGDSAFVASKWALVPRDLEGPEPEYLAKRRKGLPSVYSGITAPIAGGASMRKTKVKKIDSEGNKSILEVLIPEGQSVDGEIVEEETSPAQPLAPGTVVEGIGIVNAEGLVVAGEQVAPTPVRRRPPIPKKKKKHGPGRGRKKIVEPAPGQRSAVSNGDMQDDGAQNGEYATTKEDQNGEQMDGEDSIMHDAHQDDEEGSEEGSEGEEGEDADREEGEISPSPSASQATKPDPPAEANVDTTPSPPKTAKSPNDGQSPRLAGTPPALAVVDALDNELPVPVMEAPSQEMEVDDTPPTPAPEVHAETTKVQTATLHSVPMVADQQEFDVMDVTLPSDQGISPAAEEQANTPPAGSDEDVSPEQLQPLQEPPPLSQGTVIARPLSPEVPPMPVDPPDLSKSPEQPVPTTTETPPPQPLLSTNDVEPPILPPPPSNSDIISPPLIPHTLARFPEPPSTLPQRPLTPPPQRRHQPPSTLPPDHPRRPSGSTPEAPTPSPPTPIQTSFEPPQQGLSPKAPTMSPPTPIAQDFDSSPETALADRQQRLPSPPPLSLIQPAYEASRPCIPGLRHQAFEERVEMQTAPNLECPPCNAEVPNANNPLDVLAAPEIPPDARKVDEQIQQPSPTTRAFFSQGAGIDVEAAPRVDNPIMNAEIPHEHNPLSGFKAPVVPPEERRIEPEQQNEKLPDPVRFEDGEEDLLGTLERDLGPPQLRK